MKVLVTGGSGFIGSHLVERLVKEKFDVIVIDNLSNGRLENLKKVQKRIKFLKFDLSNKKKLNIFENIDYVFHLAALTKARESISRPSRYHKANFMGTKNLLKHINPKKIKKFIYAASASCYGNSKDNPISETSRINILSPYALTKWKAEKLILKNSKKNKFNAFSLRLFNVYGSRSRSDSQYSGVISIFVKKKKKGKPLTIVGDGNQTRSFIHVDDVVDAFIRVMKCKINSQIFNIGGTSSININNLAKLIGGKKIFIPSRKGDPIASNAKIKKIKTKLGWFPKVTLKKGLKKLLKKNNI